MPFRNACHAQLFLTIYNSVSGYPLFLLHNYYLKKSPEFVQHLFFAITGLLVAVWAIGGKQTEVFIIKKDFFFNKSKKIFFFNKLKNITVKRMTSNIYCSLFRKNSILRKDF